jgi:hypothetical protein
MRIDRLFHKPIQRAGCFVSDFAFQGFDVRQVLRPGDGDFVLNQMFSGEHPNRLIAVSRYHPLCPSFFELDPVDYGQDIDTYRFHADLENEAGCRKIFLR